MSALLTERELFIFVFIVLFLADHMFLRLEVDKIKEQLQEHKHE